MLVMFGNEKGGKIALAGLEKFDIEEKNGHKKCFIKM